MPFAGIDDFVVVFPAQTDLLGEHDGQEYELKIARLFDFGGYYLMPQIDATNQSASLVDHYSGVTSVNFESEFAVEDTDTTASFDVLWRINSFHRLELGYFELKRSGAGDLVEKVEIGDVTFLAGELGDTGFDTRILRFGYAFSLFHDAQKELAVFGGAHISDIEYRGPFVLVNARL